MAKKQRSLKTQLNYYAAHAGQTDKTGVPSISCGENTENSCKFNDI